LAQAIRERLQPREFAVFSDGPTGLAHCLATPPSLLMVDLRLPGLDGREVIRRLRAASVSTRFLVLTANVTAALPAELIGLGVAGFLDKASNLDHVQRAIERVLKGGLYFSANVTPSVPPVVKGSAEPAKDPAVLSDREREIVRLVATGLYSKEIADQLGLSPRTVEKERVQIMQKLGVGDLAGLIRWSVRQGLV
jgi:DNA-binding NarL/FixJ family response regulator